MPFKTLHVPQSLSTEMCHRINDVLHDALVETCGVKQDDYFCIINRYAPDDMILHPTFMGTRDPAATIVVEIALLAGRTEAQKDAFFASTNAGFEKIGFPPENAILFLQENDAVNCAFSPEGSVKKVLGL